MERNLNKPSLNAKKIINVLVMHQAKAIRRSGDLATAYPIRSWWWDKAATDKLLTESEACLNLTDDATLSDQILWHRHFIFWTLGWFEQAKSDLLRLNRPDGVYKKEFGRSLGFIRKKKFPHETI